MREQAQAKLEYRAKQSVALRAEVERLKQALAKIDEEFEPEEGYGPYCSYSELAIDNGQLVAKYAELSAAVEWMLKVGCYWGIEHHTDGTVVVNLTWYDNRPRSHLASGKGDTELDALLAAYEESQKKESENG